MRLSPQGRKRLATLLVVQEVSHRQLAEAVGWRSHGMVRQLIHGERSGVRPESALAIAKFLGVDVSDLFLTELSSGAQQASRRSVAKAS